MKISFGIKTNLRNETKTLITILSICEQKIPLSDYEILITGRTEFKYLTNMGLENIRLLPDKSSADNGKLGLMMNTLVANAKNDIICLMDDDFILLDGWYDTLVMWIKNTGNFDVLSFPVKNTDGTRALDNTSYRYNLKRSFLLRAHETSPNVYVPGGFVCFRKAVWESVKWDSNKGFYQAEDLDWSERVKANGFAIKHCPIAYVIHNDWRYYQYIDILQAHSKIEDRLEALRDKGRYIDNGLYTIKELLFYIVNRIVSKLVIAVLKRK